MARIPLSDKASPKECEAVYELLDHVVLENTTRGRSHEFPNTCMECDDDGLSLIFGKILNDGVIELKPSDFFRKCSKCCERGRFSQTVDGVVVRAKSFSQSVDGVVVRAKNVSRIVFGVVRYGKSFWQSVDSAVPRAKSVSSIVS